MTMPKLHTLTPYNRLLIHSGNVIELYEYEMPVLRGGTFSRKGRANAPFTSDETKRDNRNKTAARARKHVRRVVNANPQLNKFLTLTYAENMTDIDRARKELDNFFKRLKRQFPRFAYVCVIEFQKRGAVHFHLLCNLPFVDVKALAEVWGHGFIKLNRIDNVDNVGAYVTKYMTKENMDERLIGYRSYSMSRGLNQPQEVTNEEQINEALETLADVLRVVTSEYESEYYGTVHYTQIICRREAPSSQEVASRRQHGVQGRAPVIGRKKRRGCG